MPAPKGNKNAKGKKTGRKSKLTNKLLEAGKKILKDSFNVILLTDDDFVFLLNQELEENEQITKSIFKQWKAGDFPKTIKQEYVIEFLSLIKKTLLAERQNLFRKMERADKWQKYAWIIERKFDEWNLTYKSDNKNNNETVLKIDKKTIKDINKELEEEF